MGGGGCPEGSLQLTLRGMCRERLIKGGKLWRKNTFPSPGVQAVLSPEINSV